MQRVCPPELLLDLPVEPVMPDSAVIEADADTLAWLSLRFAREALMAARLIDARSSCPHE